MGGLISNPNLQVATISADVSATTVMTKRRRKGKWATCKPVIFILLNRLSDNEAPNLHTQQALGAAAALLSALGGRRLTGRAKPQTPVR
jgi:hypothetical protein